MPEKTKFRDKIKNWFKESTRIVGMNAVSFEEKWRVTVSKFQLVSAILVILLLLFGIFYFVLSFTKFGDYLTQDNTNEIRTELLEHYDIVKNYEEQVDRLHIYIQNLQNVILGEVKIDSVFKIDENELIEIDLDTSRRETEILLSNQVMDRQNKSQSNNSEVIRELFLLDPVQGRISQGYDAQRHPAVDIVATSNSPVLACLEGVVIHSGFDEESGWMVMIKHANELVSTYKHLSKTSVKSGEFVKTGTVIGVVGNTGRQSSGPHLHFELWSVNGALNPMDYLSFGK